MEKRNDFDCSYLLKDRDPSRILRKALALLEHPITAENVARQLKVINQYLLLSRDGFLIRRNLPLKPAFEESMRKLIDLCAISPTLTRTLELFEFSLDIHEFFSWLGYMIAWLSDEVHQIKIAEAIYALLSKNHPQRNHMSLAIRIEKAHASKLSQILGELIEVVETDVYYKILGVIHLLIIDGPKSTSELLLRKGVVSTVILRLEPSWMERFPAIKPCLPTGKEEIPHTETIFDILTSLLKHATSENMRAPSKFTLWSLQWAFRVFTMKEANSVERNNVLAVLLLLMDIYPDLLLGNLTFAYDIAMLAMTRDIQFHTNWTSEIKLTTSHEDHSCMALLLMCISYFPNCLSGPKVIEECRVVMGLLKLIGHQQAIKWHPLQACYLIRLSLNILLRIVPASTEEFIEDGGPLIGIIYRILQLLSKSHVNPALYGSNIVFRSVELLAHLSYKFKSIRNSVAFNGGMECILKLTEDILKREFIGEQEQKLLSLCICLLEQVCDDNNASKVLPSIINYMRRYIKPNQKEHVQAPDIIITCLSFIWNVVLYSKGNAEQFVKMDGVYLMLDIVETGCLPVQLVALGTLIDLCEVVQCIPYLITWRKNGKGIKSVLMQVFRSENKQLLTKIDDNGIITDYLFPLMGEAQYDHTYCVCHQHRGNATISDMFVSCRPKIYCLLQILDEREREVLDIVNEFYKTYDEEEIPIEDQVTCVLAENYLALKLGEQWKEIIQQFSRIHLKPIPTDEETLNIMADITDKWSKDIQKIQQDVLRKYQLKEHRKEEMLYNTLRDACLSDAWESLRQMKYIARCSERLFRITSNFNLQSQIVNSLQVNRWNGPMHRTFQSDVSVTCLRNQNISIRNEGYEEQNLEERPAIVSPGLSGVSSPREMYDLIRGEYLPETAEKCVDSASEPEISWRESCLSNIGKTT